MKAKCCVFVDGENLRHALLNALQQQTDFKTNDYLPQNAKWREFFDWIVKESTNDECVRLRTYWYSIEHVDYYPFNLKKMDDQQLRTIFSKHQPYKASMDGKSGNDLHNEIEKIKRDLIAEQQKFHARFDGWQKFQNGIALKNDAVEFRRSGAISYNLFEKKLGDEKTVDVRLALDTVMLSKIYDVAIIVSGDQDYVPAAQVLKDLGKTVVNVAFEKKNGDLLPGGARRLNIATDKSFNVAFDQLVNYMGVTLNP
jgi:uncharacterized LabA/DUF88 family protein